MNRPPAHPDITMFTIPLSKNTRGFTLIESIIYIALFGVLFSGIFVSMYPIFQNAELLTKNIATEGETAFILSKFHYALAEGMQDPDREITAPAEGATGDTLVLKDGSTELFRFESDDSSTFCSPPRLCSFITYSEDGNTPTPLNADRIFIKNLQIRHIPPSGNIPRVIEVQFVANDVPIGPIRYYLHF